MKVASAVAVAVPYWSAPLRVKTIGEARDKVLSVVDTKVTNSSVEVADKAKKLASASFPLLSKRE
jgi:hypothetical protein